MGRRPCGVWRIPTGCGGGTRGLLRAWGRVCVWGFRCSGRSWVSFWGGLWWGLGVVGCAPSGFGRFCGALWAFLWGWVWLGRAGGCSPVCVDSGWVFGVVVAMRFVFF